MIKRAFGSLFLVVLVMSCRPDAVKTNIVLSQDSFQNPPREAGIRCWWWWMNSNVTKESITQDLEAMHDKGYSGAMIFDAGTELNWGPDSPVPNGPMFSGPEWTKLYLHALTEAKRLDMVIGLSIQSGWNLGGPTITLDDAAKQITWSEIQIEGSRVIDQALPMPNNNFEYYRDICVLAYPDHGKEGRKPINNLAAKSGAHELGGSAPDCRFLLDDFPEEAEEEDARWNEIVNITQNLGADGKLKWNVPAGKWTVMRFGYTPTLAEVKTSSDNWKGHVLDYLDPKVFDRYWDEVVDPLLKQAGPLAGTVLKQLETDSWECGGMNWSPGFAKDFQKYRGYDLIKYLPVIAGKIVDNRASSNAFLADLRKTIAGCVAVNHYKNFADHAAKYGIGIQPESAGPHAAPIDGISNYAYSDIVMSEFWVPCPHRPNPGNRFFVKQAASAAHIYGKQFVGAESFTSLKKPIWSDVLWKDQKPAMDHEFCAGLNMIFVHTFTASPTEMGIPGQQYFAGTAMNRNVSWWDYSDGFIQYMSRVQYVLQKGKMVADVLYYYGDHVPNIATLKESDPAGALPGFDYDVTNEDVLLQLKVVDGKVVVPGGVHYRLLVLPDHKVLSLAALQQVEKLLNQGATVLGPKPRRLVSLVGGQPAQKKFQQIANKLWGVGDTESGQRSIRKGKLVWGQTSHEYLLSQGNVLDFEAAGAEKDTDFDYIHYTVGESDVYFVSNQTDRLQSIAGKFRVSGKQPEIWDPVTGKARLAVAFTQAEGLTAIPLEFDPYGSFLLVFRNPVAVSMNGKASSNFPSYVVEQNISGPWQVRFDTAWGGPELVEFKELTDWTQSADERIKYYSGKAEYTTEFSLSEKVDGKRYWLQLNEVADVGIASIELNGKDMGIVWTQPFRMEISGVLRTGQNQLKIMVVNNWQNRLIGDRGKPQEQRFTMTNVRIRDDWKLLRSGLLGPVSILAD